MILHRPADDPAAVQVHDGGQIQPSLIGLDVGDVGEPDPVRRSGGKVALEQVWGDREIVTAIGGTHPSWPRHDGANAVMAHQPLDPASAHPAALSLQFDMDTRATIASMVVVVDQPDVVHELTIGDGTTALRARAPSIVAG